jgi:hypothetical protein
VLVNVVMGLGAFGFGLVIGWFTYFVNRYRTEVALADVATVIGALGGAAVLALFPAGSALFGAYGIGLAVGFFGYLVVLVVIMRKAGWPWTFLLDGRTPKVGPQEQKGHTPGRPLEPAPGEADNVT